MLCTLQRYWSKRIGINPLELWMHRVPYRVVISAESDVIRISGWLVLLAPRPNLELHGLAGKPNAWIHIG